VASQFEALQDPSVGYGVLTLAADAHLELSAVTWLGAFRW
jgi:hypothetical protein